MSIPLYPVNCKKCGKKLLDGAPAGSLTMCPKCGIWTESKRIKKQKKLAS